MADIVHMRHILKIDRGAGLSRLDRYVLLPPYGKRLCGARVGQEVGTELELGHGCRVYG